MTTEANWIKSELQRMFPRADLKVGVDINRNGRLEPNERIATFNSNTIPGNKSNVIGDWTDWLAFYRHNVAQLAKLEQGKSIFALSARFRPTNLLHTVTVIESAMSTPEKVRNAYEAVFRMYAKMKAKDSPALTPPEKLLDVYDIIRAEKMSIDASGKVLKHLLLDNVHTKTLDCDSSSFIISAIACEMGWPVYVIHVPAHIFLRWDDGETGQGRMRFNLDVTGSFTDQQYQKMFNVSAHSISQGVYLQNLDEKKIVAFVLFNRANEKDSLAKYTEAIKDFDEAIRIDPTFATAYTNRGTAKARLGRSRAAIMDYDAAIKFDSTCAPIYYNRGNEKVRLRRYQDAIRDHDKAIRYNAGLAQAYISRGVAKSALGKHRAAIGDFNRAIRLNPSYPEAYHNRGLAMQALGRHAEARKDFAQAKELGLSR